LSQTVFGTLRHGPARAEMAEDEQWPGGGRAEIRVPEVGLERGVVAEPLRLLVGVDVTSHPGQQGRVVHDLPVGLVKAKPLGQPHRDQALAQDVLHRLAHAQVSPERQDAEQFGQADARAGGLAHAMNISELLPRDGSRRARSSRGGHRALRERRAPVKGARDLTGLRGGVPDPAR